MKTRDFRIGPAIALALAALMVATWIASAWWIVTWTGGGRALRAVGADRRHHRRRCLVDAAACGVAGTQGHV
ncbi:MAG: hypothetical protein ACREJD_15460 [Phycisphaerales bacterium]